MKDGQLGWLFPDGTFTTETPWKGESSKFIVWNANCYIDNNPNDENYITLDDLKKHLKVLEKKVKTERNRTLASRLDLPPISFPKGFKAVDEIERPIKETLDICLNKKIRNLLFYFGLPDEHKPMVDIQFFNIGKGITMKLYWKDAELTDQWRDLKLPETIIQSLHVIISASEERAVLQFHRQFDVSEIKMLAKFLTYYLIEFRGIEKDELRAYTIIKD